jgi:hypothetical protein
MELLRAEVELQSLEDSMPVIDLRNRLVDEINILEDVPLRLERLLQKLALPDPIVPEDVDAPANRI